MKPCASFRWARKVCIFGFVGLFASMLLLFSGCREKRMHPVLPAEHVVKQETITVSRPDREPMPSKSVTACYFDSLGLVNVAEQDSTIAVSLVYATPDNFTGQVLYDDLKEAYLHPDAAQMLLKAQRLLKKNHPSYTLIIYDATRPIAVQQKLWDRVKGTSNSKYVSNPSRGGGLHNYGLAVDVSILDDKRIPLSMGTEVDHFGSEAHITNEALLVESGVISPQERENRQLLRRVMCGAGFKTLPSEWWHFNFCNRETAKQNYPLIK